MERKRIRVSAVVATALIASLALIPSANADMKNLTEDRPALTEQAKSFFKGMRRGKCQKGDEAEKFESLTDEEKESLEKERAEKKGDRKAKFESLTDEEKEALKEKGKARKEVKKDKFENLTDEEKEALKAEKAQKKEDRKAKFEGLTDEEKEAFKTERKAKKRSNYNKNTESNVIA